MKLTGGRINLIMKSQSFNYSLPNSVAPLMCVFHEAVEKSLGRPVFTHEFGLNYDGICDEFLGDKEPPTMNEILNLIPQEKLIVFGDPR
jgi:hypothetical protein